MNINIKIPKDIILTVISLFFVICEFLPIVNLIHPLVLSGIKIIFTIIFFICVFMKDSKLGLKYCISFVFIFIVVNLAYYNCWINFTTYGSFIIKNMTCWLYIEMGVFFCHYASIENKIIIRNSIFFFAFITSITTMVSLKIEPNAVRELENGSMHIKGFENVLYMRNTSTWGGLYGMVFLLPFIIYIYKKTKKKSYLLLLIILELCIIASQITTAILISAFFLIFLVFKPISLNKLLFISIFLLAFVLIIANYLGDFFYWFYQVVSKTDSEILKLRSYQLYLLFATKQMTGTILGRYELYLCSFDTFINNPILGFKLRNAADFRYNIGLHSQILDFLAAVGIFGILPFVFSFYVMVKDILKYTANNELYRYFIITIIMLIMLMITNPTYYAEGIYLSVFWGPAIICVANDKNSIIST